MKVLIEIQRSNIKQDVIIEGQTKNVQNVHSLQPLCSLQVSNELLSIKYEQRTLSLWVD